MAGQGDAVDRDDGTEEFNLPIFFVFLGHVSKLGASNAEPQTRCRSPPVVESISSFRLMKRTDLFAVETGENGSRNLGRTLGGVRLPVALTACGLVLFACSLGRHRA